MSRQLAVLVENRPGSIAEICDLLGGEDVNIEGIMLEGSLDFGVVRLHVRPLGPAISVLQDHGFQVSTGDVIVVNLKNRPGQLSKVLQALQTAKVNVDSLFGTTWGMDKARIVLRVSDTAAAKAALKAFEIGD